MYLCYSAWLHWSHANQDYLFFSACQTQNQNVEKKCSQRNSGGGVLDGEWASNDVFFFELFLISSFLITHIFFLAAICQQVEFAYLNSVNDGEEEEDEEEEKWEEKNVGVEVYKAFY